MNYYANLLSYLDLILYTLFFYKKYILDLVMETRCIDVSFVHSLADRRSLRRFAITKPTRSSGTTPRHTECARGSMTATHHARELVIADSPPRTRPRVLNALGDSPPNTLTWRTPHAWGLSTADSPSRTRHVRALAVAGSPNANSSSQTCRVNS